MSRAIVDQKLSVLLSAEARLNRTLRTSPTFDEICARYRKAEDEYNEAFDTGGASGTSLKGCGKLRWERWFSVSFPFPRCGLEF